MSETVDWEALRALAVFRAAKGLAVSLYLNLDPHVAPTPSELQSHVHSLIDEGTRAAERVRDLGHAERVGVRADFDRIRNHLEELNREGAHGLALFVAGLDQLWSVHLLTESVPDAIKVNRQLYLAPLVPLVGRGEGALVAVVNRERGQLFRLRAGRPEEVADLTEEQPRRHDQGGRAQARLQRHVDTLAHEHLKTVATELDWHVRRSRGSRVVVLCPDELRGEFGDLISTETRAAVVGWAHAEAHAGPAELLPLVVPILDEWRAEVDRQSVERWHAETSRNGRATAGWAPTLEAATDGRVEQLLFLENVEHPAWLCPACGRLSAYDGSCPLDGTRLDAHEDAVDLAVHATLAHGGTVSAPRGGDDALAAAEGIGAILRY